VNHVNVELSCFVQCLDMFMSLLAKCFDIDMSCTNNVYEY
jgi:hypothetical protein